MKKKNEVLYDSYKFVQSLNLIGYHDTTKGQIIELNKTKMFKTRLLISHKRSESETAYIIMTLAYINNVFVVAHIHILSLQVQLCNVKRGNWQVLLLFS